MKSGRLSRKELHFIEEKADSMTAEKIAETLGRHIEPIIRQLKKLGKTENKLQALAVQAEFDLKDRPYWKELKNQFSEHELDMFMYYWTEIIAQFHNDVLITEELQVVELAKLTILADRALTEKRTSQVEVEQIREELRQEKARSEPDTERVYDMEKSIASRLTAMDYLGREYKELLSKKSSLNKELKATREQRHAKMESKTDTMVGLIQKILKDPNFYEEQGKLMEKMRLSMYGEEERLSKVNKYEDGMLDRPLLNSKTAMMED